LIRLYRARFSTNVERVALALAYKGLAAEPVWIEYSDRSPVEAVSGQGLVPVLDYNGQVVADSMEIVRFLEERHPEPPLFPRDPGRRAEVLVFIDWFNRVWKPWPNAIEAGLAGAHAAEMAAALDRFESMLDGCDHLMGDDLTAADCVVFPFVKFAAFRDPEDDELFHRILDEHQHLGDDHPRLTGWIERVNARPRA
jgi:glutathione S-transferase